MSHASKDSDDLKTLQREAAELRESRKRAGFPTNGEGDQHPGRDPAGAEGQDSGSSDETVPPESGLGDLADHMEIYLKEIEEAALERPTLALLATFALGVFVGHLFTRR